MKALFVAQGGSLAMFDYMRQGLLDGAGLERAGFVLSDSWAYQKWLDKESLFEQQGHYLLKEWQVTSQRSEKTDYSMLREYEEKIGAEPGLFGAVVADRRLIMGKDCTYTQDYSRRFSDDELLSVLQVALKEVERLFDELQPDLVVSFICVTMMDYLVYLFAKSRGVQVLNIKPTRILDCVTLTSTLNDPSPEFGQAYQQCLEHGSEHDIDTARHLKRVREQHGRYEGVIRPSAAPALKVNSTRKNILQTAMRILNNYRDYNASIAKTDNHVPDPLRALWYAAVINPLQAIRVSNRLGPLYINKEQLSARRYVFFPLHTEPEVSLLVYGRPFINQIELIRAIALSLPADMILVVKEHPWMVGKRSLSSYMKLLNIPRVHLADPAAEARELILDSSMVAVITGSVALEAAILGRPVITFGDCPYNALPENMVHYCKDLRRLPATIKTLLDNYELNEHALRAYISAVFETSESISLYSVLLNKQGVHVERETDFENEAQKLLEYVVSCFKEPASYEADTDNVANW